MSVMVKKLLYREVKYTKNLLIGTLLKQKCSFSSSVLILSALQGNFDNQTRQEKTAKLYRVF